MITENSRASVRTQGALGDKFVYIEPGDLSAKALKDGDFLTSDASGDILDMIAEKGQELKDRLLVVQFGGAAGTLASLGEAGLTVQIGLAKQLNLDHTTVAWHTQRDTFVEMGNWLSLLTGSLAKIAQDIILLAQSEVGEVRETADPSRGGSSTMPQKSNPIISENIVAMARHNATLLASLHQAQRSSAESASKTTRSS